MRRFLLIGLVMLLSMFSTARSALAQTTWRGDLGTWDVHAGISTTQSRVAGFLAVQQSLVVAGENFAVVWFGRSASGTWAAHAWHSLDIASAISYARVASGDPNLFANNHDLGLALLDLEAVVPPVTLIGGLPEGDPWGEAALESEDPPAVVEFLADLGYAAAPLLSGMLALDASGAPASAGQVSANSLLDDMTNAAETAAFGSSTAIASLAQLCYCRAVTTTTYGPWTCYHTHPGPAGRVCLYSSTATVTLSYTSTTFIWCNACPAPTTTTKTVYGVWRTNSDNGSCATFNGTTTNPPEIRDQKPTELEN